MPSTASPDCLIGLDFGSDSARGVLLDAADGRVLAHHTHAYRHGVMRNALPDGTPLPPAWALQHAPDYTEAAQAVLAALGRGRRVLGIGIDFTASSPLPARADGTPLSLLHPHDPHAYVKLWKHQSAQAWAERINAGRHAWLANCGGRLSAEWLLAKAAQLREEAPALWAEADRFIEAGDWLVWQLGGLEARSMDFAGFKAQYLPGIGYPRGVVDGLERKLAEPLAIGSAAGSLTAAWRERTGIEGPAIIAVAAIDSHVVMPAVGATQAGSFVGALGTSAAYMLLDDRAQPALPPGIEGLAYGGVLPGLWCYESGQAGFGDTLAWFVRAFPRAEAIDENFRRYNEAAATLRPGASGLLALDWWNGNRVPHGDSLLSGLMLGMTTATTGIEMYRALLESLCFGARAIVDRLAAGGAAIDRVILTSGLAANNPLLTRLMADVLGRPVEVSRMAHATAIGAAIHGAVAAGVVDGFDHGAQRYGEAAFIRHEPQAEAATIYDGLYARYESLSADRSIAGAMHALRRA